MSRSRGASSTASGYLVPSSVRRTALSSLLTLSLTAGPYQREILLLPGTSLYSHVETHMPKLSNVMIELFFVFLVATIINNSSNK